MFITAALIGGAAALGGAYLSSKSMGDAADQASGSAKDANELQKYQYDTTRADNEPWRQAGQQSLQNLMGILNSGPYSSAKFTPQDLQNDPGYQFQLKEGMRAVDNSASARGGIGGAALKGGVRFAEGLAGTTYNNAFNRFQQERNNTLDPLFRVAGFGSNVNAANAAAGQAYANNAGANMMDAANARGAAGIGQANIYGNALNQGVAAWNRYSPAPTGYNAMYGGTSGYYMDPTQIPMQPGGGY